MIDTAKSKNFIVATLELTDAQADRCIEYAKNVLNGVIGKDCFGENVFLKTVTPTRGSQRINSFYLPVLRNIGVGYTIVGGRIFYDEIDKAVNVNFVHGIHILSTPDLESAFFNIAVMIARRIKDNSIGLETKTNSVEFGSLSTVYEDYLYKEHNITIAKYKYNKELGALG